MASREEMRSNCKAETRRISQAAKHSKAPESQRRLDKEQMGVWAQMNDSEKMKLLIIGCGSIGRRHAQNLRKLGVQNLLLYIQISKGL